EEDPVLLVQGHLRHRYVHAADLAGGVTEPDVGHVPDRRLLDPAGVGHLEPDVDGRAAGRAGPAAAVAGDPAVRAGVGGPLGRWHRHVRPLLGAVVDVHGLDADPAGTGHLGEVHAVPAHQAGLDVLL